MSPTHRSTGPLQSQWHKNHNHTPCNLSNLSVQASSISDGCFFFLKKHSVGPIVCKRMSHEGESKHTVAAYAEI